MSGTYDFPFGIEDVTRLLGLTVRRSCGNGVYTDCPFCGDRRGKMNINYVKNVWRCNYCDASGGTLQLYASLKGVSTPVAYREICDALLNGTVLSEDVEHKRKEAIPESIRAASDVLHATYSALLGELKLTQTHREHLREVRGLTDEEIDRLGFRSTPPFCLCRSLTERLINLGYTVRGVPGFYEKDGNWTVNFGSYTAGILLPAKDTGGRIIGFQIRLDAPLRDRDGKSGTKYVWFSSAGKQSGCSPGSPVHLIGDAHAGTVYVTEGILKADIVHCITGRTFAAIAGANNLSSLDGVFRELSAGGTGLIIEAHDMDKYQNAAVERGANAIRQLALKYGMDCKRLTWNPNYKGIDEWQLALHRKKDSAHTTFDEQEGKNRLSALQTKQCFRIYQLDFGDKTGTKSYAFEGIEALYRAGFTQPPATDYRLVYDGTVLCGTEESADERLASIYHRYNDSLPADYHGRSLSLSDVVELYSDKGRRYYYCDVGSFCEVRFSPMLAKPMRQDNAA